MTHEIDCDENAVTSPADLQMNGLNPLNSNRLESDQLTAGGTTSTVSSAISVAVPGAVPGAVSSAVPTKWSGMTINIPLSPHQPTDSENDSDFSPNPDPGTNPTVNSKGNVISGYLSPVDIPRRSSMHSVSSSRSRHSINLGVAAGGDSEGPIICVLSPEAPTPEMGVDDDDLCGRRFRSFLFRSLSTMNTDPIHQTKERRTSLTTIRRASIGSNGGGTGPRFGGNLPNDLWFARSAEMAHSQLVEGDETLTRNQTPFPSDSVNGFALNSMLFETNKIAQNPFARRRSLQPQRSSMKRPHFRTKSRSSNIYRERTRKNKVNSTTLTVPSSKGIESRNEPRTESQSERESVNALKALNALNTANGLSPGPNGVDIDSDKERRRQRRKEKRKNSKKKKVTKRSKKRETKTKRKKTKKTSRALRERETTSISISVRNLTAKKTVNDRNEWHSLNLRHQYLVRGFVRRFVSSSTSSSFPMSAVKVIGMFFYRSNHLVLISGSTESRNTKLNQLQILGLCDRKRFKIKLNRMDPLKSTKSDSNQSAKSNVNSTTKRKGRGRTLDRNENRNRNRNGDRERNENRNGDRDGHRRRGQSGSRQRTAVQNGKGHRQSDSVPFSRFLEFDRVESGHCFFTTISLPPWPWLRSRFRENGVNVVEGGKYAVMLRSGGKSALTDEATTANDLILFNSKHLYHTHSAAAGGGRWSGNRTSSSTKKLNGYFVELPPLKRAKESLSTIYNAVSCSLWSVGGLESSRSLRAIRRLRLDVEAENEMKWIKGGALKKARCCSSLVNCGHFGGKIGVIGGLNSNFQAMRSVEFMDISERQSAATISTAGQLKEGRSKCGVCFVDDLSKMVAVGGIKYGDAARNMEIFDFAKNGWTLHSAVTVYKHSFPTVWSDPINCNIIFVGGDNIGGAGAGQKDIGYIEWTDLRVKSKTFCKSLFNDSIDCIWKMHKRSGTGSRSKTAHKSPSKKREKTRSKSESRPQTRRRHRPKTENSKQSTSRKRGGTGTGTGTDGTSRRHRHHHRRRRGGGHYEEEDLWESRALFAL